MVDTFEFYWANSTYNIPDEVNYFDKLYSNLFCLKWRKMMSKKLVSKRILSKK